MNELWYRKLGFYNNPFSIKPAAFHDGLMGYEDLLDDVSYAILSKKVLFIEGDFGKGKTTLLKRILRDFGGKKQVIYFSCNRLDARLDVDRLLKGRYGLWGKLFDLKPKNMILLLDEVQALSKRDCDRIYNYYKRGFFKSVVFVGKKYDKRNFTSEINNVLQLFKLGRITEEDAVAIVRRRVGKLPLLPDSMIKKIFKISNNNPRTLLKNCEAVCRYAVEYGEDVVTDSIITEALGSGIIYNAPKEEKKFVKKKPEEIIAAAKTEKLKPIEKKVRVKPAKSVKTKPESKKSEQKKKEGSEEKAGKGADSGQKKSEKAEKKTEKGNAAAGAQNAREIQIDKIEKTKNKEAEKQEVEKPVGSAPEQDMRSGSGINEINNQSESAGKTENDADSKASSKETPDEIEVPEEELDELDKELEKVRIDDDDETHLGENGAHFDENFATEDDLEEKELNSEENYY